MHANILFQLKQGQTKVSTANPYYSVGNCTLEPKLNMSCALPQRDLIFFFGGGGEDMIILKQKYIVRVTQNGIKMLVDSFKIGVQFPIK